MLSGQWDIHMYLRSLLTRKKGNSNNNTNLAMAATRPNIRRHGSFNLGWTAASIYYFKLYNILSMIYRINKVGTQLKKKRTFYRAPCSFSRQIHWWTDVYVIQFCISCISVSQLSWLGRLRVDSRFITCPPRSFIWLATLLEKAKEVGDKTQNFITFLPSEEAFEVSVRIAQGPVGVQS